MIQLLSIDEIKHSIDNLNQIKLNKTMTIIRRYGQHKLVLCNRQDTGPITLVSGRYIFAACKTLGVPMIACYTFSNATEEDIATIQLIQNYPKPTDVVATARLLEKITDFKPLANILPFTVEELKNFKDLKDFNWDDYDNDEQHYQTSLFG